MLRNEAIYSVIYRNSKISKKSRHILAYCTDPYLLTSVFNCVSFQSTRWNPKQLIYS